MTTSPTNHAPTPQPLPWWRALALWLGLVALTLQALAPVAHAAAMRGLRASLSPDLQIICGVDGLRVIDWRRIERSGQLDNKPIGFHLPADGPQGKFKGACCCDAAAALPVLGPAPAVAVIHPLRARYGFPSDVVTRADRHYAISQPRGPPA